MTTELDPEWMTQVAAVGAMVLRQVHVHFERIRGLWLPSRARCRKADAELLETCRNSVNSGLLTNEALGRIRMWAAQEHRVSEGRLLSNKQIQCAMTTMVHSMALPKTLAQERMAIIDKLELRASEARRGAEFDRLVRIKRARGVAATAVVGLAAAFVTALALWRTGLDASPRLVLMTGFGLIVAVCLVLAADRSAANLEQQFAKRRVNDAQEAPRVGCESIGVDTFVAIEPEQAAERPGSDQDAKQRAADEASAALAADAAGIKLS